MNSPIDIDIERFRRSENAGEVTPEQALKTALEDCRAFGDVTRCLVVIVQPTPDGGERIHDYCANLTRSEEAGYLALALHMHLDDWRK